MSNQELPASNAGETMVPNTFGFNYGEFIELLTELIGTAPGLFRKAERTKIRDAEDWVKNRLVLEWYDEP